MLNETWGLTKACLLTASTQCANSVASVLRNFLLAGVLKKSSLTSTLVPSPLATTLNSPERASSDIACTWSGGLEAMLNSEIEAMAAKASPLKPMEATDSRSSKLLILLVA